MSTSVLDRLRQPEYTGENRCIPCTAANVVIAAALGVVIAVAWGVAVGTFAWLVGAAVVAVGLAAVWLRGYLVPGTPELTKRYFPERLLAVFDKGPEAASSPGGIDPTALEDDGGTTAGGADGGTTAGGADGGTTAGGADGGTTAGGADGGTTAGGADDGRSPAGPVEDETGATVDEGQAEKPSEEHPGEPPEGTDAETMLLSAGVVEPCEDEDDLCMDEAFRSEWHERMAAIRDEEAERDGLARELDLDPEDIEFEDHGDAFVARTDGRRIGQWESRGALVADLAAARELPDWVDGWDRLPVGARSQLLGGLRIFLDSCPICDGQVSAGMETVESCCRSHEVVAATCEACDSRLLEVTYREPA